MGETHSFLSHCMWNPPQISELPYNTEDNTISPFWKIILTDLDRRNVIDPEYIWVHIKMETCLLKIYFLKKEMVIDK